MDVVLDRDQFERALARDRAVPDLVAAERVVCGEPRNLVINIIVERCGAVAATLDHLRSGTPVPGHLELLVAEITPAARRTRALPGDWAEHTVRAHTAWVRDAIRADSAFAAASVVAARFDLDSGLVSLLP